MTISLAFKLACDIKNGEKSELSSFVEQEYLSIIMCEIGQVVLSGFLNSII